MLAATKVAKLRNIVAHHQHAKVDGIRMDVQTANVILTVYDALNAKNQETFGALSVPMMARVAWKLLSKPGVATWTIGGANGGA